MSRTLEQFVRFTTDAAGLERTFRLFQSIAQILSSYTLSFEYLLLALSFFASSSTPTTTDKGATTATATAPAAIDPAATHAILVSLRVQLALARRYFRLFRFLESFLAAQKIYASLSSSRSTSRSVASGSGPVAPRWETTALWIDVFGRTFNGMYLLLEASTILDAQRIQGLAVWGSELEGKVFVEGQRFWFFSLACGVLAGLVRIADVVVPYVFSAPGSGPVGGSGGRGGEKEREQGSADGGDEKTGSGKEAENVAQVDLVAQRREVRSKISSLTRRVVSDALDCTLPGSVVGWVPVSTGTVGLAMFVTTILTSKDIWERCGREVAASNGK
ncbi:hypothetical protein F5Y01DRAFT_268321 [Xylaria sp. FL0043]|nr:hypothetical protein F5Y01DRAFT_268321 [Xylaria sp. FL0043]